MVVLRSVLLSGFLAVILIAAEKQDSGVSLTAKYSYNSIKLVCKVSLERDEIFNIYLQCPFGQNQICYINCDTGCRKRNCIPMISGCVKSPVTNNFRQIEWTIDITKINRTGEWMCSHRNIYSEPIIVEKQSQSTVAHVTSKPVVVITGRKKIESIDIGTVPSSSKNIVPIIPENNSHYQDTNNDFWVFITNPNVVLILVCVFTVSLLFNIIFLIRCALLRSLIDQYIQSNKVSDSCLYRCFCIRINDGQPQPNMKSLPSSNTGNVFVGYHREDVYDDMSASSQAERHLISNYSQYEPEQESLLARKFWSPDGSQSLMTRPPQFYQGQPVSNYVIVSGPVYTNRGHGVVIPTSNISNVLNNSQRTCITDEMSRSSLNDSNKNDSSMMSDSNIYSQPMKNRPKSFDQFTEADAIKMTETSPPAPPIRTCTDTQCYRTTSPCMENMPPSIPMKNVDLIEHCSHPVNINSTQENHHNRC